MIRKLLSLFGYSVKYQDHRGIFEFRYGSIDFACGRPIHEDMPIAYPWADRLIIRDQ